MKRMAARLMEFACATDGPTATEYAFMLALLVIVCVGSIGAVGYSVSDIFSGLDSGVQAGAGL